MNDLNLEANGFGSINEANLEINKINVVGGVNSSGKSTVSRILYSFLKASILTNERYIKKVLVNEMNSVIDNESIQFSIDDDFSDIKKAYYQYVGEDNDERGIIMLIELLSGYEDNNDKNKYDDKDYPAKNYFYSKILSELIHIENIDHFEGFSRITADNFESFMGNEGVNVEFDQGGFVEDYDKDEYDAHGDLYVIKTRGVLDNFEDVYYMDTFSSLDMLNYIELEKRRDSDVIDIISPKNHVSYLINSLNNQLISISRKNYDNHIIEVFDKINDIIQGYVTSTGMTADFHFIDETKRHYDKYAEENIVPACGTANTASGIKQFGVVQLLLLNNEIKPGTFLIFDEPEVNLHPEWQLKFAEILVLLVKELDITLYINSHSSMFIEAMEVLTQYYDLEDETNFYLTEKQDNGKYDFVKVDYDNIYDLYDNLAKPYDAIEVFRLKAEYKKGNY